jgi:hypothetical protein
MNTDNLTKKLKAWRVAPCVPPAFRQEVWQRIAARQAAREDSFASRAVEWLACSFARPRYATGFAAMSLVVGMSVAHERAQEANARDWSRLEVRYARTVSPFLHHASPGSSSSEL